MRIFPSLIPTKTNLPRDAEGDAGGGGAAPAAEAGAATEAAPGGEGSSPGAADDKSLIGGAGEDSVSGGDTQSADTTTGGESGPDSVSGESGSDSVAGGDKIELLGAPADDYVLTLPEDSGLTLDDKALALVSPVLKELNISQDGAQALMTKAYVPLVAHIAEQAVAQQAERFQAEIAQWAKDAKEDARLKPGGEVGFPGGHDEAMVNVARARNQFLTPAAVELLDASGFGNHPEFVVSLAKIGKALSDGSFHLGGGGGPAPKTEAEAFYGDTMKRKAV